MSKQITSFILIFMVCINSVQAHTCPKELSKLFKSTVNSVKHETSISEQVYLSIKKRKIISQISKICQEEKCSDQEVKVLMSTLIKESKGSFFLTRRYLIILSIMTGTSWFTAYLTSSLSKESSQIFGHFLLLLSSFGLYTLGAPILEPITASLRKLIYKFTDKTKFIDETIVEKNIKYLDDIWYKTQETLSINEQMSRNILVQLTSKLSLQLLSISNNQSLGVEDKAKLMALFIIEMHELYPDIDLASPQVFRHFKYSQSSSGEDLVAKSQEYVEEVSLVDSPIENIEKFYNKYSLYLIQSAAKTNPVSN